MSNQTRSFILHVCVSVLFPSILSMCRFFMNASGNCQSHKSLSSSPPSTVKSSIILLIGCVRPPKGYKF